MTCQNNLKQFGIALHRHEEAKKCFPSGAESRAYAKVSLDPVLFLPLVGASPLDALSRRDDGLQCPGSYAAALWRRPESHAGQSVRSSPNRSTIPMSFGPAKSGGLRFRAHELRDLHRVGGLATGGGSPFKTDGIFFINSEMSTAQITDGLSHTAAMSESILGDGPAPLFDALQVDPRTTYAFVNAVPLTETACKQARMWNFTDLRGFSWANGEYRCTLYNHYWTPNSTNVDCVSAVAGRAISSVLYSCYGWRSARSRHPGGVNVLMADGSGSFYTDDIDLATWKALAIREGKELDVTLP